MYRGLESDVDVGVCHRSRRRPKAMTEVRCKLPLDPLRPNLGAGMDANDGTITLYEYTPGRSR